MIDIEFICPKCAKHLVIDSKGAGKTVPCPECAAQITIPAINPAPISLMEGDQSEKRQTKTCPYCSKEILAAAIKCKHCGQMIVAGLSVECVGCDTQKIVSQAESPEDLTRLECPNCKQHLKAPTDLAGKNVECPSCKTIITIPMRSEYRRPSQKPHLADKPKSGLPPPVPPSLFPTQRPHNRRKILIMTAGLVLAFVAISVILGLLKLQSKAINHLKDQLKEQQEQQSQREHQPNQQTAADYRAEHKTDSDNERMDALMGAAFLSLIQQAGQQQSQGSYQPQPQQQPSQPVQVVCPTCGGTGRGENFPLCQTCFGKGLIRPGNPGP